MQREKLFYCYNFEQAKFFKNNGIPFIDFGINPTNKRTFFVFERNDQLEVAFQIWNKNKQI
jgi:hypothetical protein